MARAMSRITRDYPPAPIPGTESLGNYPADGDDDAKLVWLAKFQRAAQSIPGFPASENDRLELEYGRVTYDVANKSQQQAIIENDRLRSELAARPQQIADLVTEKMMADVYKFVGRIITKFTEGIVYENLLPRLAVIKEQTATLPALEARQLELETRLRLLIGELGLGARVAMHEDAFPEGS
jgi:hypothetical protein